MSSSLYKWIEQRIKPAVQCGTLLDIGPGRLRPGLSLLTDNDSLDLISIAYSASDKTELEMLIKKRHLGSRVNCEQETLNSIELPDHSVDAVISFGAMHQWKKPAKVFDEIKRVLKHNGPYFIGDARSDTSVIKQIVNFNSDPHIKRLYQQRKNCYSLSGLRNLLLTTKLDDAVIKADGPDLWVVNKEQ